MADPAGVSAIVHVDGEVSEDRFDVVAVILGGVVQVWADVSGDPGDTGAGGVGQELELAHGA